MYQLTAFQKKVFDDRYALKDEKDGQQLEVGVEEMWRRISGNIAKVENTEEKRKFWEESFYAVLENFRFVPGGRILAGAGNEGRLTFYNCFVIPSPQDSRAGILDSVKLMVEIMSRSGGVGVNLSSLRPRGTYVRGVNGTASGAVSFGGLYSYATGLITQGGSRRGALMLMLNDDHPDIEEFITVKRTMGLVTNANLSVGVSDRFMEAVKTDSDWDLKWGGKTYKTVKASYLWNLICESAHASGEPGLFFLERANKQSNTWYFEEIISTNPCGEVPLGAWSVCNLGAMNLSVFVNDDGTFDFDRLRRLTRIAVRFLDNVIDATYYPFSQNEEVQKNIRRTGLGTMGLADALIKLKIRYGSEEARAWCEEVYRIIRDEAYRASVELAALKGPFLKFDKEKYLQGFFIKQLPNDIREGIAKYGIRNAVILTQAPTGTTSALAGASSGIEPVYDFITIRRDRLGEHELLHPLYAKRLEENGHEQALPNYFVTSKELTPEEHAEMQAIIQKYTDSSISKTVNAPETHTIEEVKRLYVKAYDLGCKGVTYFRENSRDKAVLYSKKRESAKARNYHESAETQKQDIGSSEPAPAMSVPRPRPEVVHGSTYKVKTGYGTLFVTVNNDEAARPFEVFATIGKTGGFFSAKSESVCRLVSLALRSGIDPEVIIDQLRGIRGPMPSWNAKYGQVLSIPDAIAHVLQEHSGSRQGKLDLDLQQNKILQAAGAKELPPTESIPLVMRSNLDALRSEMKEGGSISENVFTLSIADRGFAPECPECGTIMHLSEGCMNCAGCGFSKCG